MRSKFFTLTLAAAALAVAASATLPAVAATSTTIKVPFSFSVDGKICPAGTYSVERDLLGMTLKLHSQDASKNFAWITTYSPAKDGDRVTMQFDSRGQIHALRSIQSGSLVTPTLDRKHGNTESISPQDRVGQ